MDGRHCSSCAGKGLEATAGREVGGPPAPEKVPETWGGGWRRGWGAGDGSPGLGGDTAAPSLGTLLSPNVGGMPGSPAPCGPPIHLRGGLCPPEPEGPPYCPMGSLLLQGPPQNPIGTTAAPYRIPVCGGDPPHPGAPCPQHPEDPTTLWGTVSVPRDPPETPRGPCSSITVGTPPAPGSLCPAPCGVDPCPRTPGTSSPPWGGPCPPPPYGDHRLRAPPRPGWLPAGPTCGTRPPRGRARCRLPRKRPPRPVSPPGGAVLPPARGRPPPRHAS